MPAVRGAGGSGVRASSLARIAFDAWGMRKRLLIDRMPQVLGKRTRIVIGKIGHHAGVIWCGGGCKRLAGAERRRVAFPKRPRAHTNAQAGAHNKGRLAR
jgi:hypothetical protein